MPWQRNAAGLSSAQAPQLRAISRCCNANLLQRDSLTGNTAASFALSSEFFEESDMPRLEDDRIVETATEARAGATGHNVRYVLVIGIVSVCVLFAIAYLATRW